MVDLESVLVQALLADPELVAIIGGSRIYTTLPSDVAFPCVRLTLITGGEDAFTWQPSLMREAYEIQLDSWGGQRWKALEIANAIRVLMSYSLVGPVTGGAISGVRWDSLQSLPDDDAPTDTGRARPRYIAHGTVTVHHGDLSPAR